jgi:hypothetical protein
MMYLVHKEELSTEVFKLVRGRVGGALFHMEHTNI